MQLDDTILATSSPPGRGGMRGILRLSGPEAWRLARSVTTLSESAGVGWHGELAVPLLHPRNPLAAALLFRGPRSFTGQDVAELHVPNSPALLRCLTEQLLTIARADNIPLRLADPGEFSARAFFNGKIDLTEAEGIAATINATNERELRAAASLRQGDLHKNVEALAERLANLLALVEAGIDFVEEEGVSFISAERIDGELSQLVVGLQYSLAHAVRVDRLDMPPTVVFIGQPNVGKSSLINALTGVDRSIASPIAGTTRDMLAVTLRTESGEVRLVDVPGEEPATDELRQKMMAAREAALLEADLVIEVLADDYVALSGLALSTRFGADAYTVQNKVDLLPPEELRTHDIVDGKPIAMRAPWQLVSARTGLNILLLREEIGRLVHRDSPMSPNLPALNQRHRLALQACKTILQGTSAFTEEDGEVRHPELLAAELRRALDTLGEITGTISPDDVLGRIFSRFCIGK